MQQHNSHHAGIMGPWGKKEDFSLPGSVGPEGERAQAKQKADWLHMLSVFVSVSTPFFPVCPLREEIFLSLISTVEHHGVENEL